VVSADAGNLARLGSDSLIYAALPVGFMSLYAASATPPVGWMICNGSTVSRTTYSALFALIGTSYGAGDGSTTFNLPDCRGRSVIGFGQGTGLTNRALGANGGEENHTLLTAELAGHNHAATQGTHTHTASHSHGIAQIGYTYMYQGTGAAIGNLCFANGGTTYITGTAAADANVQANSAGAITVANTGSDTAHNNMQPFVVASYIIKVS
jgi:microcystin-dependent protein